MLENMTEKEITDMRLAQLDWITEAQFDLFEYYVEYCENFEGSDYEQGVKDGLRIARTFLGSDEMSLVSTASDHPRRNTIEEQEKRIKELEQALARIYHCGSIRKAERIVEAEIPDTSLSY